MVYHGFDGEDAVNVNRAIFEHIRRRHVNGAEIGTGGREGILGIGSMCRGGGVQQESKLAYGVRNIFKDQLSRGSFPTVRATAVGRDAVLAGDPKVFRLLCNTNLNMNIPSRGSKEERIRISCKYGLIYRVTDIINKPKSVNTCQYM